MAVPVSCDKDALVWRKDTPVGRNFVPLFEFFDPEELSLGAKLIADPKPMLTY